MRNRVQREAVILIKGTLVSLALLACSLTSISQCSAPNVPEELVLAEAAHYGEHKALVKKSLAWLVKTPMDECTEAREELNAFVVLWLSGSPEIRVDVKTSCMPFIEDNEDLFFTFLHGVALYQINHRQETDPVVLHAQGLKSVAFQVREAKCSKSPELKAILKADRKNRLEEYATECLAISQ
ncbi:MAG: hypothetical protein ACI84C_001022 [Flavobacteriales bacterium]|jgi:hypothetical protein